MTGSCREKNWRPWLSPAARGLLAGLALTAWCGAAPGPLRAAEVHVAVAANFTAPLAEIGKAFEASSGYRLVVSSGSTGKLVAQIDNGAPFEVLLAADAERPALLEKNGEAVAGSRFTYARGRLVLWSPDPGRVDAAGKVLAAGRFRHLAIANPQLAPYGAAAQQTLTGLGLWEKLAPLLVQGEDIGQTYQFVASGAAELGFVALSQVRAAETGAGAAGQPKGSPWIVPESRYQPIDQQAVLLTRGSASPAARAFLEFLRGQPARAVIERYGYGLPAAPAPK
jgi:molybdate transport system substrate-binding protein